VQQSLPRPSFVWPGRSGDITPSMASQPSSAIPGRSFDRFDEILYLVEKSIRPHPRPAPANQRRDFDSPHGLSAKARSKSVATSCSKLQIGVCYGPMAGSNIGRTNDHNSARAKGHSRSLVLHRTQGSVARELTRLYQACAFT
jgi:hypothetical protein